MNGLAGLDLLQDTRLARHVMTGSAFHYPFITVGDSGRKGQPVVVVVVHGVAIVGRVHRDSEHGIVGRARSTCAIMTSALAATFSGHVAILATDVALVAPFAVVIARVVFPFSSEPRAVGGRQGLPHVLVPPLLLHPDAPFIAAQLLHRHVQVKVLDPQQELDGDLMLGRGPRQKR